MLEQAQKQQGGSSPFSEPEWKIPGYTGFSPSMQETYKKTPFMAQLEAKAPTPDSFVHTRKHTGPKSTYHSLQRDACNHPEELGHKHSEDSLNLFPCLQERAAQDSFKPPCSNIALGDDRISPFHTSYTADFHAPFAAHSQLRSPMRNKDLAATQTSLVEHYASSYNRVGDKRLAKMISTMRERVSAKLGNNSDNAFRMRKLFRQPGDGGLVHFEDFRTCCESFGMQLDDDSLLALYHVYDPQGSGYLAYEAIVEQLLDADIYSYYSSDGVDNTQALADAQATERLVANLRKRINGSMADMRVVFESFDAAGSGLLPYKAFQVACAALGVVLSPQEQAWVKARAAAGADAPAGCVKWGAFCEAFC